MKKRTILSFGVIMISIFLLSAFIPYKWSFVFFEQRTTHTVAYLPLQNEKSFQIRYTHSIHLSDVLETYKVSKRHNIQLSSLEYEDFAIGMPSGAGKGENFVEKEGKYYITNMSQVFPSFDLHVGDIERDLAFRYVDYEYNLKNYLTRGETYTFQVARLSLVDQVKGARLRER
ncbi:DUF1850 domain-containing protein [Paenisporosarcina antarctica]|uniref:DUF1850 domain-containing protein n=1 Tax=Paenisporosarcina antarctica TaxID=417367 RepID=A0A4P6ZYU2_9BACL|nr:DUF1850 domain-containing protein [Paenisporosarcina antarctica]QBP41677.1 DUF1850 domain-containing protein [Paenisporosarcina antarctica]